MANSPSGQLRRDLLKLDRVARKEVKGIHPEIWRIPRLNDNSFILQKHLKEGDVSTVSRVHDANGNSFILKHYKPTRRLDIRDLLGHSKAIRSFLAAESIQRRGFLVGAPLAAWSKSGAGSFFLLEDLPSLSKLQDYLKSQDFCSQSFSLQYLAKWAFELHSHGIWYRDLKPSNILVEPQSNGASSFVLIDHDRNRFLETNVPRSKAIQDLAALYGGFPDSLSPKCRLTFLEAYCDENSSSSFWESWVRPIEKLANQRRHKRNQLPLPQLDKP
jgi:serine/threonine protein kinase